MNITSTFTTHARIITLAALVLIIPIQGCASSSTRSKADSKTAHPEIDPTLAYIQNRRSDAIKHYNTASALDLDGKPDEALEEYRRALELDDKLYAAWNNMGRILMSKGNYADAVSAYQIASGIEPTDPRPEFNIGIAYKEVGWAQESFDHFQLAIERDPTYLPALHGVIRSAEMLGLGDEQILEYIRSAQLRETNDQWKAYLSTQYYRVKALLED